MENLPGCQMPGGPAFSPSLSDTLDSPPPARPTVSGRTPALTQSPSDGLTQSSAAATGCKEHAK